MARRGLSGQLNMFDFFRELEAQSPQAGEIEMVSLMPEDEDTSVAEDVLAVEEMRVNQPELLTEEPVVEFELVAEEESVTEEQPIIAETIAVQEPIDRPVMHRTYVTDSGTIEIAYINYSKVRLCEPKKAPVVKEFETSKEAVDYYVEQMQKLEELYGDEETE